MKVKNAEVPVAICREASIFNLLVSRGTTLKESFKKLRLKLAIANFFTYNVIL
jgi:hypothetical protein